MLAVQIGRAHLGQHHAQLTRQKAGQRDFQLRVGEEEDALAAQRAGVDGQRLGGSLAGRGNSCIAGLGRHAHRGGGGMQPGAAALDTERKRACDAPRAAGFERLGGIVQKWLGQQHPGARTDARQRRRMARGEKGKARDAHGCQQAAELVFDHIRQRADDQQRRTVVGGQIRVGQFGGKRCQAGVLSLCERRLDAAARVVEHPHLRHELLRQSSGSAMQIELDDLRRAGADEKQQADVGAALQQLGYHPVEFLVHIGQTGQIAFIDDGRGKPGLGKNHHAGRRLDQMGTGARADHQEERILHLAVQPDDAGQTAEHLALPALLQHRRIGATALGTGLGVDRDDRAHADAPEIAMRDCCKRAARSFRMNCVALIT